MASATASASSRSSRATRGVDAGTSLLRCRACGSREPTRAPARVHGWQRCRHCGEVIVAPWSDWEAFDGPSARTVVLEQRARAHFMVPRRTLLRSVELAAWLFIVNTIAAFCVGLFEIDLPATSLWRWLGPLGCGLAGLAVSALFVRLWSTVQHLEINPRRIERYRSVGRRRYRQLALGLRGGIEVTAGEGVETVSENRYHVRVHAAGTGELLADLIVPTRREAEWVAVLLRRAADPEPRADTPRCSGCGAPLPMDLEAYAAGGVSCSFCDAGYVVGARELRWPPLLVPCPELLERESGGARRPQTPRVRRRRERGPEGSYCEWEVRPGPLAPRMVAALGLGANVLLFLAFGIAMVWISGHTPPGAVGMTLYILLGSGMMFGIAGFALLVMLLVLFGREVVAMDEGSLWTACRLGGFDLKRLGKRPDVQGGAMAPARWRSGSTGLPLLRLTRVETQREGGLTRLRLETPTRRLEAAWELPPEEDHHLLREIATLLGERLRALGRDVALRPESGTRSSS
jgi:hypothetical protein